MNKNERKTIFFNTLSPYFSSLGFTEYLEGGDPSFAYKSQNIVIHFFFNFISDEIGCSPLFLTNYEVEDYILKIGIPTNSLIEHKKKLKYHLPTIVLRSKPNELGRRLLDTEEEIQSYAKSFIRFYEKGGNLFYSENESVLDIFNNLTRLESQGEKWKVLVSGMGDAFIRVLIISKLCNDPDYSQKFDKINAMIQGVDEWQPYWEKYKEVLASITPKYNLEV